MSSESVRTQAWRSYGDVRPLGDLMETAQPVERAMNEDLRQTSIQTISRPTKDDAVVVDFEIKHLICIGSYSWVDDSEPTIIVPGSPPIWKNKKLPYKVYPNTGIRYIDQNGFRVPSFPFLPTFKAIDVLEESRGTEKIHWPDVDFVTDRNGLRKLLRWINGVDRDGEPLKDFRIDTQLAGQRTVLFNRWEKKTFEPPTGSKGYGINFERVSTTPVAGCAGATGHYRIIKYDFDGLILVVRFEVDACIEDNSKPGRSSDDVDDLSSLLTGLAVSSSSSSARKTAGPSPGDINIIRAGRIASQKNVVELTTRSTRSAVDFPWGDVYPQLFLSQTPHLFLAIHTRGRFEEVQKEVLGSPKMRRVERELNIGLKKLRAVLETIQNLVIDHGKDGRLTLLCQEGELKVYERVSNRSCLPRTIMARFEM